MRLPFGWRLTLSRGPSLAVDYDVRRAILVLTKAIMDKTEALAALTTAVSDNTTATNAAVAKLGAAAPVTTDTGVDPDAVAHLADIVATNTAALNTALSPAPAPAPAAPVVGDASTS